MKRPITLTLALLGVACYAQAASRQTLTPPLLGPQQTQARRGTAWLRQPWDGNDRPYRQIRTSIDKAIARAKPRRPARPVRPA